MEQTTRGPWPRPALPVAPTGGRADTHLHLLVSVLGRVFAALALPAQLLQLRLALLQTLPFALVLRLVLLERRLVGGGQYRHSVLPAEYWSFSVSPSDSYVQVAGVQLHLLLQLRQQLVVERFQLKGK